MLNKINKPNIQSYIWIPSFHHLSTSFGSWAVSWSSSARWNVKGKGRGTVRRKVDAKQVELAEFGLREGKKEWGKEEVFSGKVLGADIAGGGCGVFLVCLPWPVSSVSSASGMKGASANTELCKADQLHFVWSLRVITAGSLHRERINPFFLPASWSNLGGKSSNVSTVWVNSPFTVVSI